MAVQEGIEDEVGSSIGYLKLLRTIGRPRDESSIPSDTLATELGIDKVLTGDAAIRQLEKELLAPVKDLSDDLARWQV